MKHLLLATLLVPMALGIFTGCGGLDHQVTALNPAPRRMPPKATEDVHVFTSGRPAQPYHEVFLMQTEEASVYSDYDEAEALAELRKRAAIRGCDAIIVLGPSNNVSSLPLDPDYTRTLRGVRATCAVYDRPSTAAQAASPSVPSS